MIYFNFNLKTVNESKTSEISISLIEVEAEKNINKSAEIKKEEPVKKAKPKPKTKPKPKLKAKPKEVNEIIEKSLPEIKKEVIKEVKEKTIEPLKEDAPKKEIEEKPEKIEEIKKPEKEIPEKEEDLKKEEPIEEDKSEQEQEKEDKTINNLENINLSVREKFNIHSQLKICYKKALDESGDEESEIRIVLTAEITKDGFIDSNLDEIIDLKRYEDDDEYKVAINNAKRALELCSPLRNLPVDKYEIWKEVVLEFGEEKEK